MCEGPFPDGTQAADLWLCSHLAEGAREPCEALYRAPISFISTLIGLNASHRPHHSTPSVSGVGFQHVSLGGIDTQTRADALVLGDECEYDLISLRRRQLAEATQLEGAGVRTQTLAIQTSFRSVSNPSVCCGGNGRLVNDKRTFRGHTSIQQRKPGCL